MRLTKLRFRFLVGGVLATPLASFVAGCGSGAPGGDGALSGGGPSGSGAASPIGGTGPSSGSASSGGAVLTGGALGVGGSGGAGTVGGGPATGGNDGGGTGGSGTGGSGPIVGTFEITVEPNPNSVLSAYVSWTTTEPASSVVQFGTDTLTWEITGEPNVTTHKVLVIGMRASTEYKIRAVSTGASGTLDGQGTFTTQALPAQIPVGTVSVNNKAKAQPGWTLMNLQTGDGTTSARSGAPPAAVIYDEEGQPVWYFINGTMNERGGAISVDMTDKGVLMGATGDSAATGNVTPPTEVDWSSTVIWKCPDPKCGGTNGLSHHTSKLKNGHYITMRDAADGSRTSQVFEELDPAQNSTMVFSIGVLNGIPTPPAGASGDWAHGNAIVVDLDNDLAYMNFRWLGLMKMKYSTKELLWHLPAKYGEDNLGKFTNKVLTFDPPTSQYSDTHDPEIHADGTILFFDNGGFTGTISEGNPGNLHTRAVEYKIDETAKTAKLVWEWPGDASVDAWYKTDLYVPFWGGVHTAPNGNVIIAAGRRGTGSATPETRIIEVEKATKEVVWELKLPPTPPAGDDPAMDYGVYRAERLWPLPLVHKIGE